ncbi:hypothetical protein VNN41_11125 (plasmid) [Lactococcus garvieae]|uniref:hypothetical protein n=1 Tax=Lactococcus garvieae TaxID=1363 RepID=UPI00311B3AE4
MPKTIISQFIFYYIQREDNIAVKRAALAPAEQAVLLTSTAEPLHDMVFLKES